MVNGFINRLQAQLVSTSTYSAIANLQNSQITTAISTPLSACYVFTSLPWQRLLRVDILQLRALRFYLHSLLRSTLYLLNCQLNYSVISSQPTFHNSKLK
jgi:hypothetical protein